MNKSYNDYMASFAIIPKEEKKKEIIKKLHELNETMLSLDHSSEMLSLDNIQKLEESMNEDDYLRAVFSHLVTLEEILGKYLEKRID